MRKPWFLAGLILLSTLSGCSWSDMIFGALSDHYSGGGDTLADKQYHYDQQMEAARSYPARNP